MPKEAAMNMADDKKMAATETIMTKIDASYLFKLEGRIYNYNSDEFKKILIDRNSFL